MNEIKKWENHTGAILDSVKEFDVIECDTCGFAHVIPLPDEKNNATYYKEEFYHPARNYIEKHTEDLEWWSIEHNEKYDFFEKHFSSYNHRQVLDIGSGPGYFLKVGEYRGWTCTGIEPAEPAYRYAKDILGLTVFNDIFSEENYQNFGKFHVIHMNNVLEHIIDPKRLISLTHRILEPNGLICITVPNDYNPLQKVVLAHLEKSPWWIVPKEHLNYFNPESLSKLLEKLGFKVLYRTSSFPLELFLLMGDDYIGNSELGRAIHSKRKVLELAIAKSGNTKLKREMYNKFFELGIGREITVVGEKNYERLIL